MFYSFGRQCKEAQDTSAFAKMLSIPCQQVEGGCMIMAITRILF